MRVCFQELSMSEFAWEVRVWRIVCDTLCSW
jgi:hypothetical protein